jgi:hypothetical protein
VASGPTRFLVFISGGAWCWTLEECEKRLGGKLGSSDHWAPEVTMHGVMSSTSLPTPWQSLNNCVTELSRACVCPCWHRR